MESTASRVTDSRKAVVERLKSLHTGEESIYTGCVINCGGGHCVHRVRRKNGKITAIEPDDHYNPGVAREDNVATDTDFIKNRLQLRGCPMAWVFHKLIAAPDRILHPLKRKEGTRRGEGQYEPISWEEALDLVAGKMKEIVQKYGPYSITTPYQPSPHLERLFGLWGAGIEGWGWCSRDAGRLAVHLMTGVPGWSRREGGSNDMADVLMNAKMIVLWGLEPTIVHFGPGHQLAYFIKMARERGVPVICIEPRYTVAAEVLADQWIPIKPGTDTAMMLAVTYVLITEGLYDREFVEKFVDLDGFDEWKAYILGETDGTPKTPEWAEKICAVPAETIRGFTRLYASKKPTWLWVGYGPYRKSRGENMVRAAMALQAVIGYWGVPGGSVPDNMGMHPKPAAMQPYGEIPQRMVPKMYRSHKWAQMVLLLEKVQKGEMSVEEYKRVIGWRAPERAGTASQEVSASGGGYTRTLTWDAPADLTLPNPKMLFGGGTWLHNTRTVINAADATSDHIKAMERMEFNVWVHSHMSPALYWADVILPIADQSLEDSRIYGSGYGGFANLTFVPGVVEPPGEARPAHWIYSELARRVGIGEQYNQYYKGCGEGNDWKSAWKEAWETYLQGQYDRISKDLHRRGMEAPSWEGFRKTGLINVQEFYDQPYHGYREQIQEGKPFKTRSGKIEIFSYVIGDETERGKLHVDDYGQLIDNLPNDWRDLPPIPAYQPMYRGMEHADIKRFPLFMLSCYPRYRNHTTFWNVPWLRGDCYRHAIWMNVADAKARGIKDGELARVFNDKGTGVIPAYVTSRLMPGVVVIHHGGNYEPDKEGVDWGCTPNNFLTDPESPVTPGQVTNLVQVGRYEGPVPSDRATG
ncbi:MAG: molybdopterin-dependent oxidoreductase [Deltaproteobacteria bacterium]|nr:molybdopterin-dependent oxidoreductase [Deltaproteobacteria bacterium]